jgi:dienelactone hydrolase
MKLAYISKAAPALSVMVILALAAAPWSGQSASSKVRISIVSDDVPGLAARHGLNKLAAALKARGVAVEQANSLETVRGETLIVAGRADASGAAAVLSKSLGVAPPEGAESLLIRRTKWNGKATLLVSGADDRGLMYALLDVADRVGWAADPNNPLGEVRDAAEKPYVAERGVSIYTMQQADFERRFFNEEYWTRYFDMLARDRFNTFILIFGYENAGYFAPAYPYFLDVEGFPDVRVVGLTKEQQQRNLKMLNRLIEMARERGLDFTAGLWDHIYRGGVQSGGVEDAEPGKPRPGIVTGLTEKDLMTYHKAALAKFLKLVPNLHAVQFRMHSESGLKKEEMPVFWKGIYQVMKDYGPNVLFDARIKDFPDSLIDMALEMGVKIRLNTKYWAEQVGLPFHPTHINKQNQHDRRHGYADLLRYPQRYGMQWQLWTGGTTRVLLWGDPEYARRFAESTHIYDGSGFEVNEMLATKMASHPHEMKPFDLLRPQYRYYDWEFERYWHFFQVFGRLGYNPDTPPEVWGKEFERRFGKEAAPFVEQALHRASWVLPMAQAYNFPYNRFPTTRGWVEKQRREDLPAYAKAEPSDTEQFLSMEEAARNLLEGKDSAKRHPLRTSQWFAQASADVLRLVGEAESRVGQNRNKEFNSTMVDLKILANLALYHSRRIHAGLSYALFKQSQDATALDDAIAREGLAIQAWEKLVEAAGDVYSDDLMMGLPSSGLSGHWRDELVELKKGLKALQQERESIPPAATRNNASVARFLTRKPAPGDDGEPPTLTSRPVTSAPAEKPLTVTAEARDQSGIKSVRLRYRSVNQYQDYRTLEMTPTGTRDQYQAVIPAEQVLPQWDLMYFIEAIDNQGNGTIYPDLEKETPYVVVKLQRSGSQSRQSGSEVERTSTATETQVADQAVRRAAFLKLIDRPRAPLSPEAQELGDTDGLTQTHFTFAADAEQRVPGILVKQPKSVGRRPVVIALHGTGGNKEGQLALLKELAGMGFIGVAIDGRYHGERSKAGKGSADYNEAILRAYRTGHEHPFLYDTVWDVLRLIDYLETRADVDAKRIGLIGFSKGGMETYMAAAVDPRVAVAVPCIGVQSFRWALDNNSWRSRVETFQSALNSAAKDEGVVEINADFVRKLYDRVVPGVYSEFDGPGMLPLIAPRPLLVINGDSDPRTPMPGVTECATRARQAFAKAGAEEKFQLLIQEKTGHAVTPSARQAAIAWFAKWLKP